MINKESDLYQKILKPGYPGFIMRIEAKSIGSGIPDILICNEKEQPFLLELKIIKNENQNPSFRPEQLIFYKKYPAEIKVLIGVKGQQFSLINKNKYSILGKYNISNYIKIENQKICEILYKNIF